MSFKTFCERINALCAKAQVSAKFEHDADAGKFIARFDDGTRIIGHATSPKVTVRWGGNGGHCSMAPLPA